MVQIRDVPERVYRVLKARAAREGMSLSDYLKRELQAIAAKPSLFEWLDRVQEAKPIPVPDTSAELIRELRDRGSRS